MPVTLQTLMCCRKDEKLEVRYPTFTKLVLPCVPFKITIFLKLYGKYWRL